MNITKMDVAGRGVYEASTALQLAKRRREIAGAPKLETMRKQIRRIAIFGSTGSIGKQTLEVVKELGSIELVAIVCNSNVDLFVQQIAQYKPRFAIILDKGKAQELQSKLRKIRGISTGVLVGYDEAIGICTACDVDMVVNAAVGIAGLRPTIDFLTNKKDVALANKETMVGFGEEVMTLARKSGVMIIPVDSEHNAIFQCLRGSSVGNVRSLVLTASGGPFRGMERKDLEHITPEQALKHPTWNMGGRITIDSATLFNKGLELIEARWLFGVGGKDIKIVVHPKSIVHSLVNFVDGSTTAVMGIPDMRIPIQYALTYPQMIQNRYRQELDLAMIGELKFEEPDEKTFDSIKLAREAMSIGGTAPAVINAADEAGVDLFLNRKIGFLDIPRLNRMALERHKVVQLPLLEEVLEASKWAKAFVRRNAK